MMSKVIGNPSRKISSLKHISWDELDKYIEIGPDGQTAIKLPPGTQLKLL